MAHRPCRMIFGAMSVLSLIFVSSAWALPNHDYDIGWGKGGSKHEYESYEYEKHSKNGKHGKSSSKDSSQKHKSYDHDDFAKWGKGYGKDGPDWGKLSKHKGWGDHDYVKWGKGYGKDDPDCDPPVSTPEPATLLLLGSTLAGLGVYARRRKPDASLEA